MGVLEIGSELCSPPMVQSGLLTAKRINREVVHDQGVGYTRHLKDNLSHDSPLLRELESPHIGVDEVSARTDIRAVVVGRHGERGWAEAGGNARANQL